jgi:hypothetical protein
MEYKQYLYELKDLTEHTLTDLIFNFIPYDKDFIDEDNDFLRLRSHPYIMQEVFGTDGMVDSCILTSSEYIKNLDLYRKETVEALTNKAKKGESTDFNNINAAKLSNDNKSAEIVEDGMYNSEDIYEKVRINDRILVRPKETGGD